MWNFRFKPRIEDNKVSKDELRSESIEVIPEPVIKVDTSKWKTDAMAVRNPRNHFKRYPANNDLGLKKLEEGRARFGSWASHRGSIEGTASDMLKPSKQSFSFKAHGSQGTKDFDKFIKQFGHSKHSDITGYQIPLAVNLGLEKKTFAEIQQNKELRLNQIAYHFENDTIDQLPRSDIDNYIALGHGVRNTDDVKADMRKARALMIAEKLKEKEHPDEASDGFSEEKDGEHKPKSSSSSSGFRVESAFSPAPAPVPTPAKSPAPAPALTPGRDPSELISAHSKGDKTAHFITAWRASTGGQKIEFVKTLPGNAKKSQTQLSKIVSVYNKEYEPLFKEYKVDSRDLAIEKLKTFNTPKTASRSVQSDIMSAGTGAGGSPEISTPPVRSKPSTAKTRTAVLVDSFGWSSSAPAPAPAPAPSPAKQAPKLTEEERKARLRELGESESSVLYKLKHGRAVDKIKPLLRKGLKLKLDADQNTDGVSAEDIAPAGGASAGGASVDTQEVEDFHDPQSFRIFLEKKKNAKFEDSLQRKVQAFIKKLYEEKGGKKQPKGLHTMAYANKFLEVLDALEASNVGK